MKLSNFTKGILLTAAAMASAVSFASDGSEGKGGGGVLKNGVYMTFYSAGLYVEPSNSSSEEMSQIPAINKLFDYIENLAYLSQNSKNALLNEIMPTGLRKYYIANAEMLTPTVRKNLIAEFARVTNVDTDQLQLFALTDTSSRTTFLLPEFFKLSGNDQMAILFHENYWLLNPDTTYNQVVSAEMAFEAALQSPNDPARQYSFITYVERDGESLPALMRWDVASGSLKGFLNDKNQFSLLQIYGKAWFDCEASDGGTFDSSTFRDAYWQTTTCYPLARNQINILLASYPSSMFLKHLANSMDNGVYYQASYLGYYGWDQGGDQGGGIEVNSAEQTLVTVGPDGSLTGTLYLKKGSSPFRFLF